jgi:AcrR family transcriptional regulator
MNEEESVEPETAPAGEAEELGRSAQKRQAILDAATGAFLRNGYLGTSMDEIAAEAGVSKQTVYRQFTDKKALFTEIVLGTIDQVGEPFFSGVGTLDDPEDLEADLRQLARRLISVVRDPRLLQLRRLVIGEAGRFPELGRTYFERGPSGTWPMPASSGSRTRTSRPSTSTGWSCRSRSTARCSASRRTSAPRSSTATQTRRCASS